MYVYRKIICRKYYVMSPSHTSKQGPHIRRLPYASSEGWHTLKVICGLLIPVRRSLHSNLSCDTSRKLKIHGTSNQIRICNSLL